MKIDIIIRDMSLEEARIKLALIGSKAEAIVTGDEAAEAPSLAEPEKPPKRKRRTKAQIESDERVAKDAAGDEAPIEEAPAEETPAGEPAGEPTTRRRRTAPAEAPAAAKPRPRRRAAGVEDDAPPAEEITDEHVMTATSEAAGKITPKKVLSILEEFGVVGVGELNQDQRREFMDRLSEEIAKGAGLDDEIPF